MRARTTTCSQIWNQVRCTSHGSELRLRLGLDQLKPSASPNMVLYHLLCSSTSLCHVLILLSVNVLMSMDCKSCMSEGLRSHPVSPSFPGYHGNLKRVLVIGMTASFMIFFLGWETGLPNLHLVSQNDCGATSFLLPPSFWKFTNMSERLKKGEMSLRLGKWKWWCGAVLSRNGAFHSHYKSHNESNRELLFHAVLKTFFFFSHQFCS